LGRLTVLLDFLWPLHETRGWYHGVLALLNDLLVVLPTLPPAPERRAKEITLRITVARVLLAIQGYTDEVERLYREAIALAEVEGHLMMGPALAFKGQWREGLDHLDRAVELFDPERHRSARFRLGPNPGVAAAAVSALFYWQFGYPEMADRRAATAFDLAARV